MKKAIVLFLTLAMVIGMSSMAMAATVTTVPGADTKDVTATYTPAGPADTVYSVDVAWGAMTFAYTGESNGAWDPQTHTYTSTASGSWSTTTPGTTNKVTVTNHSNAQVAVTLSYAAASGFGAISGSFNQATKTLAAGAVGSPATADKLEALLTLSGKPAAAITAGTTVGTVTVTLGTPV